MKKRWIVALGLLAAAAVVLNVMTGGESAVKVNTAKVGQGDFECTSEVSGEAVARDVYTAMPSVSGRVARVFVSEGQRVKKGDKLFSFDETSARNVMKQAQYELDAALAAQKAAALEAALSAEAEQQAVEVMAQSPLAQEALAARQAEMTDAVQAQSYEQLMRQVIAQAQSESVDLGLLNKAVEAFALLGGNDVAVAAVPEPEATAEEAIMEAEALAVSASSGTQTLDDARRKRAEEAANSAPDSPQVLLSREKVRQAQETLNGMTMTSRIDGEVLGVTLQAGEIAAAGTGAVVVGDTGDMRVNLRVPEYELKNVEIGQSVRLNSNGTAGMGKVVKRGSALSSGAYGEIYGSVEVEPEAGFAPLVGASVEAEIILDFAADTLYIPRECVVKEDDGSYVYAINDGVAVKKLVAIGLENDYFTELLSGVVLGEVLVIAPYDLLDGSAVRVM